MESTYLICGLVLIAAGFLLLGAELLLPSGTLLVLSVGSLVGGVILVFLYNTRMGWYALGGVGIAFPLLLGLLAYLTPRTPIGQRLILAGPDADEPMGPWQTQNLEHLKGRIGRAISALRPAGLVDFDGLQVDTLTEGMHVEPGKWVRCVDVRANRVIVRPLDDPGLEDLDKLIT